MNTAEKKMTAARYALVNEEPFWGSLAMSLDLVSDPTCKTAWVNGQKLGFNPAYIDTLSHDVAKGLLAHEVEHVALGHPWRREGRDPHDYNVAADKVVNHDLREAGFKLPDGVYYAEGDEIGKSTEWVYTQQQQQQAEQQPEPQPEPDEEKDEEQDGAGDGDEDGEDGAGAGDGEQDGDGDSSPDDGSAGDGDGDGGEPADGQGDGDGQAGDGDPGDPLGEVRDAPTGPDENGDPAPTEQDWRERVAAAAVFAKGQGKYPASLERQVERVMKPSLDVKSLLLRFFTETAAADYAWSRPNRRYMPMGLYLPSLRSEGLGEIAMYVDTSGSMRNSDLEKAKAIIESVIEECNPLAVTVYYGDSDVAQVDRFEQGEPLEWRAKGGGGTDFRPIFEAVEKADSPVVAVVCISDLDGAFPHDLPAVPTMWLSTDEYATAPFGETVYIGD
jgi:predicted metal-dependent peptidase